MGAPEGSAPWTLGVLLGGMSRRMGRPKHALPFGSGNLLQHVIENLGGESAAVLLSVGRSASTDWGYDAVRDRHPGQGPLAGIESLLEAATTPWLLVTPCDMPWMDGEEVRPLLEARRPELDVLWFRRGARPEPMPLLVHRRTLPVLRDALSAGRNKVTSAFAGVAALAVEHRSRGSRDVFQNLNTPEDYRRALDDFVS